MDVLHHVQRDILLTQVLDQAQSVIRILNWHHSQGLQIMDCHHLYLIQSCVSFVHQNDEMSQREDPTGRTEMGEEEEGVPMPLYPILFW